MNLALTLGVCCLWRISTFSREFFTLLGMNHQMILSGSNARLTTFWLVSCPPPFPVTPPLTSLTSVQMRFRLLLGKASKQSKRRPQTPKFPLCRTHKVKQRGPTTVIIHPGFGVFSEVVCFGVFGSGQMHGLVLMRTPVPRVS
uniref:Secreted protein n=1 Tax=Schistocephalus solidus TaxID=70667 RepID=A0A0X3PNS0_SCHSO